jgi:predicted nucleotidyltransferase component of viral defense system
MKNFKTFDELAVFIINKFAEAFGNHAILKGGMVFKLLGSPRYTNDIDYVFVPYKSKNDIIDNIFNKLNKLFPAKVKIELHSKCVRYLIEHENIKIQIEVNVDMTCDTTDLSTISLAVKNKQPGKIIRVMNYGQLLSHKLAAWNERELFRDLYDIYFLYDILDEKPDMKILTKRLSKIEPAKGKRGKKSMSLNEFILKLETHVKQVSYNDVYGELSDYLNQVELAGLDKKIKIALKNLIFYLNEFNDNTGEKIIFKKQ